VDLGERSVAVEPVEGLADRDRVHRASGSGIASRFRDACTSGSDL
jgi:hypothetical protein